MISLLVFIVLGNNEILAFVHRISYFLDKNLVRKFNYTQIKQEHNVIVYAYCVEPIYDCFSECRSNYTCKRIEKVTFDFG